jgi:hypothetical protein
MVLMAYYTNASLKTLFDSAPMGRSMVTVTLEGTLATGGKLVGDVTMLIKKEPDGQQGVSVSPNPFNPQATLSLYVPERGTARVKLYDASGRLVRTLMDDSDAAAGYHSLTLDGHTSSGSKMASGVYFYRVETSAGMTRGQFVIMK